MNRRHALVIGSQCEALGTLSFLPKAAEDLAGVLFDEAVGRCAPALPDGRGLLIDPSLPELDSAVETAFARAADDEATLFMALIGHGEYGSDDFYFLTQDSAFPPSSRRSFLLAQRVKELLQEHSTLDGLVLLLDTCHAGIAAAQAADQWVRIVGRAARRFEILTASDDRTAAGGCFTRSLTTVLRSGDPRLGERLRCPDMRSVISGHCPAQTAVHLAFDGRQRTTSGDEGLWLAVNNSRAWQGSVLTGHPAAAEVERLTAAYEPTPELGQVVGLLLTGARCVAVTGAAGSGKSTLLSALARPSVAESQVPTRFLHAVLFLTPGTTPEQIVADLAGQLARRLPQLRLPPGPDGDDGRRAVAPDLFEHLLLDPLRTLGPGHGPVHVAVDGLDGLAPVDRDWILTALKHLLTDDCLGWLRFVIATESPENLPGAPATVAMTRPAGAQPPASPEEAVARAVGDAGTLPDIPAEVLGLPPDALRALDAVGVSSVVELVTLSRRDLLLLGVPERIVKTVEDTLYDIGLSLVDRTAGQIVLEVLAATGGTPLPVRLLGAASGRLGGPARIPLLRDVLTQLGPEIHRTAPGEPHERVTLAGTRPAPSRAAHLALAESIEEAAPVAARLHGGPEQAYAEARQADHLWAARRYADAVACLAARTSRIRAYERRRWAAWHRRSAAELGEDHPVTERIRARLTAAPPSEGV